MVWVRVKDRASVGTVFELGRSCLHQYSGGGMG